MTDYDAYGWRSPQPDEPSVLLPDGRTLDPLNLGAVLPKEPKNPLARLIPPQTPTKTVELLDGSRLEVEDPPLPRGALDFIRAAQVAWARKQLKSRGVL